jgi:hypothetical protein
MEVWTAEAIKGYYRDPEIAWFEAGLTALGGPLPASGYYVIHHCGRPECCRPDGPFKTADQARDWPRWNLAR